MTDRDVNLFMRRLVSRFGFNPAEPTLTQWSRAMGLCPGEGDEFVNYAMRRIESLNLTLETDLPGELKRYAREWAIIQKGNHIQNAGPCRYCWRGSGYIHAHNPKTGISSVAVCGHCHPGANHAWTIEQIEARGLVVEYPTTWRPRNA